MPSQPRGRAKDGGFAFLSTSFGFEVRSGKCPVDLEATAAVDTEALLSPPGGTAGPGPDLSALQETLDSIVFGGLPAAKPPLPQGFANLFSLGQLACELVLAEQVRLTVVQPPFPAAMDFSECTPPLSIPVTLWGWDADFQSQQRLTPRLRRRSPLLLPSPPPRSSVPAAATTAVLASAPYKPRRSWLAALRVRGGRRPGPSEVLWRTVSALKHSAPRLRSSRCPPSLPNQHTHTQCERRGAHGGPSSCTPFPIGAPER